MTYRSKTTAYSVKYAKLYRCGHRMTVDSLGTRRRIQALQAIGWSYQDLADRLDMTKNQLYSIVKCYDGRTRVRLSTAKKIAALYDELCVQPRFDASAKKTKTWARKMGYAPPMAWDDIDNDWAPYDQRDEACGRNRHPASMKRQKPNGKWECVGCKNSYRERVAS